MENWESYVRKVVPYVPGEQPQEERMIKLNTNENPYPPAPGVQRALAGFNPDTLRLYPEPTCSACGCDCVILRTVQRSGIRRSRLG